MPPVVRWKARSRPPRNAGNSSQRLPPDNDSDWPRLLGRKISIRYRLHDGQHSHSEAIGVVASVGDGIVGVLNKQGERVEVPIADIEAGKVFPTAL